MTKQKILIVQDDFLLAEGLRLMLEDARYQVVGLARDTAGADRLATQHRPALAIDARDRRRRHRDRERAEAEA